ncbi:MAG: BlaI/MecI/CopY family transcriptional regulator [bacterium]|nr:BlaI/MecI/CopY family transcriptional regulator [bacterium]
MHPKTLSELERLVMDVVWKAGPATAEGIREALGPERVLTGSTVRTVLRRMEAKGYLRHRLEGRAYIYESAEQPRDVAARAVRQILDRFCGGSVEQLLIGMVEEEIIDGKDLDRLARKIARNRAQDREEKRTS